MDGLSDTKIDQLLTRLDELVRWRPGAMGTYHDPQSALARIQGKANHLVLGRRGSGKTRLLDELRLKAGDKRIRLVAVGAEDYKNLTYPDILIQILRGFLRSFSELLGAKPFPLTQPWWISVIHALRHPVLSSQHRRRRTQLISEVNALSSRLASLLQESDEVAAQYEASRSSRSTRSTGGSSQLSSVPATARFQATLTTEHQDSGTRRIEQQEQKRVKVERLLGDFKHLLQGICDHHNVSVFLAVDDFYFIRREDQPLVIDYMHRLCKDTSSYLKVASIKHRSALLSHERVTSGVVRGHEIQPIDLELPLGQFDSIQRFLTTLWSGVCREVGIPDPERLFKGDGLSQAVLGSGGVPRDFFGVVKLAISIARERQEDAVGKYRINEAARQYAEDTKIPELEIDAPEQGRLARLLLFDIVRFARDQKRRNCFHIDLDKLASHPETHRVIDALVDARLLHLITDNTSNARRSGRFAAYLLDLGLYGHPQRRGERAVEDVRFWERDDAGRLKHLERSPVYPIRTLKQLEESLQQVENSRLDVQKAILPSDDDSEGEPLRNSQQLEMVFPAIPEENSSAG